MDFRRAAVAGGRIPGGSAKRFARNGKRKAKMAYNGFEDSIGEDYLTCRPESSINMAP
jgi:hypothetical protein